MQAIRHWLRPSSCSTFGVYIQRCTLRIWFPHCTTLRSRWLSTLGTSPCSQHMLWSSQISFWHCGTLRKVRYLIFYAIFPFVAQGTFLSLLCFLDLIPIRDYTPGNPMIPRRLGTTRGKKWTIKIPLKATTKPVNYRQKSAKDVLIEDKNVTDFFKPCVEIHRCH